MLYTRYHNLEKSLPFLNNENFVPIHKLIKKRNKICLMCSKINELSKNAVTLEQVVSHEKSFFNIKANLLESNT